MRLNSLDVPRRADRNSGVNRSRKRRPRSLTPLPAAAAAVRARLPAVALHAIAEQNPFAAAAAKDALAGSETRRAGAYEIARHPQRDEQEDHRGHQAQHAAESTIEAFAHGHASPLLQTGGL